VGELQPLNDGFARGIFFGLTADMDGGHLVRAVLEGNAFAIEHNLSVARTTGAFAKRLIAVGGPTRNALLCQIICDVTGLPLQVADEVGGAALGSGMLAAKAAGMIVNYRDMQRAHTRITAEYEPDQMRHSQYQETFRIYVELYPRVADLFPRLRVGETAQQQQANVHLR
jgi:xylulokinase